MWSADFFGPIRRGIHCIGWLLSAPGALSPALYRSITQYDIAANTGSAVKLIRHVPLWPISWRPPVCQTVDFRYPSLVGSLCSVLPWCPQGHICQGAASNHRINRIDQSISSLAMTTTTGFLRKYFFWNAFRRDGKQRISAMRISCARSGLTIWSMNFG